MRLRQDEVDALWDFDDPAGSEARLRAAADAEPDPTRQAELRTQVARALGLQDRFPDADALLDSVDAAAAPSDALRARISLERGRVRNSHGDPAAAVRHFTDAATIAHAAGLDFLHIDALHMLAIADATNAEHWTSRALEALEGATDPRTLRWAVSLHNNRGWARMDVGALDEARTEFEAALVAAERYGTPQQVQWAHEALDECRQRAATRGHPQDGPPADRSRSVVADPADRDLGADGDPW